MGTIDFSDVSTYPVGMYNDIQSYFVKNQDLYNIYATKKVKNKIDVDIILSQNKDFQKESFLEPLYRYLIDCSIVGYHFSRVLDVESIFNNGLRLNEESTYIENLVADFKKLEISEDIINKMIDCISLEYKRKYSFRKPQICFYIYDKLEDFRFVENIGGELLRRSRFKKLFPETYEILKNKGIAVKVICRFPFRDIPDYLRCNILRELIYYNVSKYVFKYEYKVDADCYIEQDLSPNNILDIIEIS